MRNWLLPLAPPLVTCPPPGNPKYSCHAEKAVLPDFGNVLCPKDCTIGDCTIKTLVRGLDTTWA